MIPNRITTSPGEMLRKEFLTPLGLSANMLAKNIGVPANRVTSILNGTRGVTANTALRLARYFGMSAEFWLNLQLMYDLTKTIKSEGKAITRSVQPRDTAHA
jgi:antitoxin HigA-1